MSTPNLIYMITILGLVWGGFGFCLFVLATQKEPEDSGPDEE
jgi:hypothetical protein